MSTDALPQRLPPHNFEAEQALLGALLLNNKAYERVSEFLRNLRDSEMLAKSPQLDETVVQDIALSNKGGKSRVYSFKMVLTLKKPEKPGEKKVSAGGAQNPSASGGA